MKIIQIIYSLCPGGAEKFVVDLSNQLATMGHDVTLCMLRDVTDESLTFNKQFLQSNVKLHSMKFSRGFSWGKCRSVEKYIQNERPDVVHCHLNVIPYVYRLALCCKKIKFFHTLHSVASNTGGTGLQYQLNRLFYNHNWIRPICISKLCKDSYEDYYKLYNAPFINNGRALVAASPYYEETKREVESYKTSPDTRIFIHVARFNPLKDQQLLVDSFNRLNQENIDFTLLVIGSDYDCEEGQKLQQVACSKIHFLGKKNNVNDYLYCADAFCLTSVYEGLPISLLEALSCGVTPICTSVGGIPDVVIDNVSGYLSINRTISGYMEAVKRFLTYPLPRKELIRYYHKHYSMAECAKKYVNLYEQ